jgi:asparagine synthase (glutamine-hydrolysing)
MTSTLMHRGPDRGGIWTDEVAGVALGFRRLAIVDLTDEGLQPMSSASGRYTMVFNGEVYNHRALRGDLERGGVHFRGRSDTEVLLEAIDQWGLFRALRQANGMFALAVWDARDRTLSLARDRMGEKPLYYGRVGRALAFGSELKALRAHPGFNAAVDRQSLALYLRHGYVPGARSIYSGVQKVPPASVIVVGPGGTLSEPTPYWSATEAAAAGSKDPYRGDRGAAVDEVERLLRDSIDLRMEADVPVGAFLSGGIDSSVVVALMQSMRPTPVRTFTIGFAEASYDESTHARRVAEYLGTDHTELHVRPKDALAVVPELPTIYDEPFADSSQIPTMLVSRLAREHVTVSLSGDGGDELFGGYNRYLLHRAAWRGLAVVPTVLRKPAARLAARVPSRVWDGGFALLRPVLPARAQVVRPAEKIAKVIRAAEARDPDALYHHLVSHWKDPSSLIEGGAFEPSTPFTDRSLVSAVGDVTARMMFLDAVTYLPDDILTKVDRASMSTSLEARVPMLDHRLVELAWRLPMASKIVNGQGKWILRQILARHLPGGLFERPKMGFAVPVGAWLRAELRPWAEDLLGEEELRRGGLRADPIRDLWSRHVAGEVNAETQLWIILMYQAWWRAVHPNGVEVR